MKTVRVTCGPATAGVKIELVDSNGTVEDITQSVKGFRVVGARQDLVGVELELTADAGTALEGAVMGAMLHRDAGVDVLGAPQPKSSEAGGKVVDELNKVAPHEPL